MYCFIKHHCLSLQFKLIARFRQLVALLSLVPSNNVESCHDAPYIILRFDDATKDHYNIVFPLLVRYSIKAVESVPIGFIDYGKIDERGRKMKFISWNELLEMTNYGWDVAIHGYMHLLNGPYVLLNNKALIDEIVYPLRKAIILLRNDLRIFVPPGTQTHQNPLGLRETKLIKKFYNVLYFNSGYNYPIPVINNVLNKCKSFLKKDE